jgi:hypothetical protein
MRKLVWITTAVVALAGAGMAVAHGFDSKSVKSVSATFTATTANVVKTSTCTGSDGTYASTKATYSGTAVSTSGDPNLSGPITLDTESLVNTTTGVGTISARLKIGTDPNRTDAEFEGVVANGNAVGLAAGQAHDPHTQLLANLSAAWSATGGFTNGFIGHGASGGDAVESLPGGCKPVQAPKPETIDVHGAVTAISTTLISAAGVTCIIPPSLTSAVTALNLANGSQVEMTCTASGGTNTLTHVSAKGGDKSDKHGKRDDRRR